jgi:hypothetical protein
MGLYPHRHIFAIFGIEVINEVGICFPYLCGLGFLISVTVLDLPRFVLSGKRKVANSGIGAK